jgi:hypothetical protein
MRKGSIRNELFVIATVALARLTATTPLKSFDHDGTQARAARERH